jgi:probable O-glycosylation ligase (exosortase A-associated)
VGIRDILILVILVASVPVCFVRPFYGVLVWSVVSFLNPHRFAWAAQNFPVAIAVGIPTIAGFLLFSPNIKTLRSREVWLMAILGIWFTITSIAAANNPVFIHHIADTWEKWRTVSKILLMAVVTIAVVNSFSRLRTFVLVIAGGFGILILKILPFMILTGGQFRAYGPPGSMIADNNDFGLALNMMLPMFFFLALSEERPWVRRLFGFLFIATIPAIFCTYSRGALVGLLSVGILLFMRVDLRHRIILIPVAGLAILLVFLAAPEAWKQRMNPTREGALDRSAQSRLDSWAFARHLAYDYPITGGGFATFTEELSPRYARPGAVMVGPHSVYYGLLAEHGFVGLGLYLVLVASCFWSAHGLIRQARLLGDTNVAYYADMFRFSLVGFLTSGIFLGRAYFDLFFAIAGCFAILKYVAHQRWTEEWVEADSEIEEAAEERPAGAFAMLPEEN